MLFIYSFDVVSFFQWHFGTLIIYWLAIDQMAQPLWNVCQSIVEGGEEKS
jgi:hypothetical protein